MVEPGSLFFAYGSLMDPERLAVVIGGEPLRGHAARIDGWRVAFHAREPDGTPVAGLEEEEGCRTYGVVYRMPWPAMRALDQYEGPAYRRATLWIAPLGRPARQAAIVYLVLEDARTPEAATAPEYLDLLIRGASVHGLPESYIGWLRSKGSGAPVDCYREAADPREPG